MSVAALIYWEGVFARASPPATPVAPGLFWRCEVGSLFPESSSSGLWSACTIDLVHHIPPAVHPRPSLAFEISKEST
jgi:hypothetical protein